MSMSYMEFQFFDLGLLAKSFKQYQTMECLNKIYDYAMECDADPEHNTPIPKSRCKDAIVDGLIRKNCEAIRAATKKHYNHSPANSDNAKKRWAKSKARSKDTDSNDASKEVLKEPPEASTERPTVTITEEPVTTAIAPATVTTAEPELFISQFEFRQLLGDIKEFADEDKINAFFESINASKGVYHGHKLNLTKCRICRNVDHYYADCGLKSIAYYNVHGDQTKLQVLNALLDAMQQSDNSLCDVLKTVNQCVHTVHDHDHGASIVLNGFYKDGELFRMDCEPFESVNEIVSAIHH
ncbi:MAG: hypothetical protein E7337_08980 [Clostridiales bacterium]|nr:hypothetical protein [Clostridiales bacterium]